MGSKGFEGQFRSQDGTGCLDSTWDDLGVVTWDSAPLPTGASKDHVSLLTFWMELRVGAAGFPACRPVVRFLGS